MTMLTPIKKMMMVKCHYVFERNYCFILSLGDWILAGPTGIGTIIFIGVQVICG